MVDLIKSREKIDEIDGEIIRLFQERMNIAGDVAAYKRSTGKKVFDKQREDEKIQTLTAKVSADFDKQAVKELFTQIMSISRKLQYRMIQNTDYGEIFHELPVLPVTKESRVICFGAKASHTEQAAKQYFGSEVIILHSKTFQEVMEKVSRGEAEYGVLPIENTSTGGIADIYDLLVEYDNCIVGEQVLMIQQALLGLSESRIEEIKTVYSHPQGILQCSSFLKNHKDIEAISCTSTSDGAQKVAEGKDPGIAAIAGPYTGICYGLKVLAESINDNLTNSTRFIIITKPKLYLDKSSKISMCFELPHHSGSLYNILSHFIYNSLNLTKIESRPMKEKPWEYRFFVDIEGNLNESSVMNALTGLREEANHVRILGNF